MTMRKVLIFALVVAIALGGIGFAQAAVTGSQDDLLIYPSLEIGDRSALEGLSASMTFNCGEHLLWNSSYAFGGETETQFVYNRAGFPEEVWQPENRLDFWLSGGMSASTTGTFSVGGSGYGTLFQAVADETANGGSRTMKLELADYTDYYYPDFELYYQENNHYCSYSISFTDLVDPAEWFAGDGVYAAFLNRFRFPVQENHTVSVTVSKDSSGRINSFDFYAETGPDLYFVSHVNAEGIWFVPIFRDEAGTPLSYESPEGHGIYFVPWKVMYTYDTRVDVTPDLNKLRLLIPLEESLLIDHLVIDGEANECRMLSREGGSYVLSVWDLTTGAERTRLEVLPYDPGQASFGAFTEDEGRLLVTAQGNLALVDPAMGEVLLTAPDVAGQRYGAAYHNAPVGDMRFDGTRLYLLNPGSYYNGGTFWTAVWQEGELLYYGEYDCSLMRGNDDWYYNAISVDSFPMKWK